MAEHEKAGLGWDEVADICRRLLTPAEVAELDHLVWREVAEDMRGWTTPPEELARQGVTALLRLPTRSRA